jgi:hypothetical protein
MPPSVAARGGADHGGPTSGREVKPQYLGELSRRDGEQSRRSGADPGILSRRGS